MNDADHNRASIAIEHTYGLPVHPAHRALMRFDALNHRAPWWMIPLAYLAVALQWIEDHTDEYADSRSW